MRRLASFPRSLTLAAALLAVVAAGALLAGRAIPGRAARAAAPVATTAVAALPQLDTARETWHLDVPPPVRVARPPAPKVRTTAPAPDWSALRAGVVSAAGPADAQVAVATAPAELEVALSARERRALIAAAREPESLPGPRHYRPGIAVIVPAGGGSDGICR